MADFTALKTAIQTYIKKNGNEEITGEILQEILLSVVTTLGDSAINDLVTALANEVAARQNADGTLQQNITNEATARGNADTALGGRIDDEATARANGDTALSNRLGSTITAENTAADQIGAEAEARAAADTALQELIDGITDNIENGYVYAGIATPSSTPATGKVFYLALTAGTYTNFGSTVVSQGINILKYNGSTWSLDAFIGIDDTPTAGSDNLVKSGGVANVVGNKITDVSFENQKQSSDLMPIVLKAGVKYYLQVNSVTENTRIGVSIENQDGSGNQYIGNIAIGGKGIVIIPESDKAKVRTSLIDIDSGSLSYSLYVYGIKQEFDDEITELDAKITTNSNNIAENAHKIDTTNSRVNTLDAEVGVYEIALPASAGVSFNKNIHVDIPKGELYAIYVDYTNIISDGRFVLKYNDSDEIVIRPTNKTWTTLFPNVNVNKLNFVSDGLFVTGSGDIIVKIKKLQSLTADGKLPLYEGGLNADGTTFPNGDRKTTRVIFNDGPLYLELNSPYNINYFYGDDPTNLTYGDYIQELSGGGQYLLDVNAKYVGFTIVKTSSDTFDNLRFIVANADSNVAKLSKQIDIFIESTNNRFDADGSQIQKAFNTGNVDEGISKTVAAVAGVDYENIIPVVLRQGDVIMFRCDSQTNNPYPTLQYDDSSTPLDPSTGQYDAQSPRKYGSWYAATITQDTTFLKAVKFRTLVTESGDITFRIKRVSPLLLREKMFQFMNTITLSDLKYTVAMGNGLDISDKGEIYGSITCSETGYGEYDHPWYVGGIVTANIADLEKTKQTIIAIKASDSNWPSLPGYYCEYVSYCFGPVIVGNKVHLGVNISIKADDLTRKVGLFIRKYDIETGEFDNDMVPCDVDVLGTVYPMQSIYTRATTEDDYVISAETVSAIQNIWQATGIEHPESFSTPKYKFAIGSQIIKCPYDNYFYVPVTMGNESHALCKSLDLIHWEYVCDIPFNQISLEEACVVFATKGTERRIYALSRGQFGAGFDNKDGRIMYCAYDDLEDRDNSNWSTPVVIRFLRNERPTLAVFEDVLYIMGGTGSNCITDGYTVPRGEKFLITMDLELNFLTRNTFDFTYPILHFHLFAFGGQLWFYTASDKRCFFATHSGDTRNEISFARVDDKILKM